MPKLLAIDTSTDVCSVALTTTDGIQESISHVPRAHTQLLLPMISSILDENAVTLSSLDGIAFGCGPGSFTGLRICLSVAQGLAFGADLPLIPISTLKAMAAGALRQKQCDESLIVPIIDARMDEVYWSAYKINKEKESTDELLVQVENEHVSTPQDCVDVLLTHSQQIDIGGIGSGWHYPVLQKLPSTTIDTDFSPLAYDVAGLAVIAYKKGELTDPLKAEPTYLRNEISWQKRQRIRKV